MTVLSHQAHMIWLLAVNQDTLGELGIIMNFNDHTVTWDTDTIPMKDRDTALYHQ
jgi:xylose isomerase